MALLDIEQVQTDLGRNTNPFSSDEQDQVQFVIDLITGYIESECFGLSFTVLTDVTKRLQADSYGVIELPFFPINTVSSVKSVKTGLETVWDWDYFSVIFDLCPFEAVDVKLTYGYDEPPADLVLVARSLAKRNMDNPLNIRQQTVGAISETYGSLNDSLNEFESSIIDRYRLGTATSIRLNTGYSRRIRLSNLPIL
jgi:hypothetical protein